MSSKISIFIILIMFLLVSICALLLTGPVDITLYDLVKGEDPFLNEVVSSIRMPKLITALLAGASLATCGLLMQAYFANPLADPSVLGINSGAAFGVAIWMFASKYLSTLCGVSLNLGGEVGAAIVGSLLMLVFLLIVSFKVPGKVTLLVIGLLAGHLLGGIINLLVAISDSNAIKSFIMWGMGNFQSVTSDELLVFVLILSFSLLAVLFLIKPMNVMILGDRYAHSVGVRVRKIKIYLIIVTAVISGTVTSFCGPIIFLGIMAPHLARSIFKTFDHKVLFPGVMLIGAIIATSAELIASYNTTIVLPLNAILGIIAAPVLYFIFKGGQKREAE